MTRGSVLLGLAALAILAGCQGGAGAKEKVSVTTLKEGNGKRKAEKGDLCWVLYTGRIGEGQPFDTNEDDPKTKEPFMVAIGAPGAIAGFSETLKGMSVGQRVRTVIPPSLGYGETGNPPNIPPNATLTFEIELLGLVKSKETSDYFFEDTTPGTGATPKDGDKVGVRYKMTYLNGKLVDDTSLRGNGAPAVFVVGQRQPSSTINKAIPGIDDTVRTMKVGGKRTLILPPDAAFGYGGTLSVKGNQMLRIELELVSVNGA